MEIVTSSAERMNLMSNWNGKERRKYPRYPFSADVLLKLEDDSEKHLIQYHGHGKNISLKGICIKISPEHREIKEKIKLQVRIPMWSAKQRLELTGQVAWCSQDEKGSKIGIQFLSNNNKGKEVLLFQLVEDVGKKASGAQTNVRIIRNADLARGKVIC